MTVFNTSLVREKITFIDGTAAGKEPVVIRSNRIFLPLGKNDRLVIRAQNMHTTLRLAAKALYSHHREGDFSSRAAAHSWQEQWETVLSTFDREHNEGIWAAIYLNGKSVFKTQTSPFVDIIEKCALLSTENYDGTMEVTEKMMKQIGQDVSIQQVSNVAAVFTDNGEHMRCGIMHRSEDKDSTFSFAVVGGQDNTRIVQTIGAAAAFLEAFNLRFMIKGLQAKINKGEVPKVSPEGTKMRAAIGRQTAINKALITFEESYQINYRPAKPDLFSDR